MPCEYDASRLDGRTMLREALFGWPDAQDEVGDWLCRLPYGPRRAVELVWGRRLSVDHAACLMGVTDRTIQRWLRYAYDAYSQNVAD